MTMMIVYEIALYKHLYISLGILIVERWIFFRSAESLLRLLNYSDCVMLLTELSALNCHSTELHMKYSPIYLRWIVSTPPVIMHSKAHIYLNVNILTTTVGNSVLSKFCGLSPANVNSWLKKNFFSAIDENLHVFKSSWVSWGKMYFTV